MKEIIRYLQRTNDIQSIIQGLEGGMKEQLVAGVANSARSLFVAAIQDATKKKGIIITHQLLHAQQLYDD